MSSLSCCPPATTWWRAERRGTRGRASLARSFQGYGLPRDDRAGGDSGELVLRAISGNPGRVAGAHQREVRAMTGKPDKPAGNS